MHRSVLNACLKKIYIHFNHFDIEQKPAKSMHH